MYLSKIRVIDYKSFRDSGEIEFKQGINLIVGQNNSGKTSLLEALSLKFTKNKHKPIKSQVTAFSSSIFDDFGKFLTETVTCTLFLSPEEIKFRHISAIPFPSDGVMDSATSILNEALLSGLNIIFSTSGEVISPDSINYGLYKRRIGEVLYIKKDNDEYIPQDKQRFHTDKEIEDVFGFHLINSVAKNIYLFKAQRFNLGKCKHGRSRNLETDASNLAEVLQNTYLESLDLYEEFITYVKQVIPSIKWIDSINTEDKTKNKALTSTEFQEVRVWREERNIRNDNSTVLLSECGTGISQVLAILYVVITSKNSRTIIIDEPNSFLHPSAAQKLIQILSKPEFSHHQYFISTHSPEIVTAAKPSTITMLRYEEGETKVEQIDLSNNNGVKKVFKDLGIEPAIFAFASQILWVEGQTEAKAFLLIFNDADIHNVAVKPTVPSEFRQNRKRFENVRHIFELHKTVSGTDSVISPKMTVLLDKEIGKEAENRDLIREFGEEEFNFIPRAMFENYLLDAEAIEYILNFTKSTENYTDSNIEFDKPDKEINSANIQQWIEDAKTAKTFLPEKYKAQEEITDSEWLTDVDGAKLLDNLFKDFLGKPFGYERYKVEYGEKLTQWLLDNKPEMLSELRDFLINLVSNKHFS